MEKPIKKRFYFARHGVTEWNEKQICQGHRDIELNETGRQEAKLLGQAIAKAPFSRICVSPLKRAYETAEIIQKMHPECSLQVIDELKERCWGSLEGISSSEMYRIEEIEELNPNHPPGHGVEPRECFKDRISRGLNIALQQEDAPLIVSHGRLFLCLTELLGIPLIRQIPNATLIECSPSMSGWQINYIKGL